MWYGDHDERIAENAVRWMESNMGKERCTVNVVKGADHGLMYRTNVVVDVLEPIITREEIWSSKLMAMARHSPPKKYERF